MGRLTIGVVHLLLEVRILWNTCGSSRFSKVAMQRQIGGKQETESNESHDPHHKKGTEFHLAYSLLSALSEACLWFTEPSGSSLQLASVEHLDPDQDPV